MFWRSWHEWACAGNISGCPWLGHANASRIFEGYVATVGHGAVLNMNIAPDVRPLVTVELQQFHHATVRRQRAE